MRTPTAQRVLAAALAMIERHHSGRPVEARSLEWARFIVNINESTESLEHDEDSDQPRQTVRPAGTWERPPFTSLLRPADPFDGLVA